MMELVDDDGLLLRRHAITSGLDDNFLARQVKQGVIVRIRHGAYALRETWDALSDVQRHLLRARAVMRQHGRDVALSHTSAALQQGAPSWGHDLALVHITHLSGVAERTAAGVRHHRGTCHVGSVTRSDGHWVTTPPRTALDAASLLGRAAGVAVLDYFLNKDLATRDQYREVFDSMKEWPNTLALHLMLQQCDGRSESVGETRTRLLCHDQRLPRPQPQFEVQHPSGRLAGRVDFAWPEHRLLLEFDGREKYFRFRREGETIAQMVMREKAREDLLRELTGWLMIRLIWADLASPVATANRIRRAFQVAAA